MRSRTTCQNYRARFGNRVSGMVHYFGVSARTGRTSARLLRMTWTSRRRRTITSTPRASRLGHDGAGQGTAGLDCHESALRRRTGDPPARRRDRDPRRGDDGPCAFTEPTATRGLWLARHPYDKRITLERYSFTGTGKTDSATTDWLVWAKDPLAKPFGVSAHGYRSVSPHRVNEVLAPVDPGRPDRPWPGRHRDSMICSIS